MSNSRLGVDVGGTFTDLVALGGGDVQTAKVPSTPQDQSEGVMNSVRTAEVDVQNVAAFAHGMTVATNALLERKGAKTAIVTTEGFRDVLEIARQDRPDLYDLTRNRPEPLVPRELRFTVKERMGPDGEIEPLDEDGLKEVVKALKEAGVEAVAVCLLFAFMHSDHEKRIGEALREELPDVHVSLSSEVLPEFREYERFSTTTADAYLGPRLAAYLKNLDDEVEGAGMPEPLVMQSSGGVIDLGVAARGAAACVLSGPAGGVVGAAYVAKASGYENLLTFDMGGTSSDVAAILEGEALTTTEAAIAGVPIKLPVVDIHTVSAGGGSLAWVDAGGALRVGPHSAGAEPGPASYDKGGEEPAVTDANLFLGYLQDGTELGGEVTLNRELAGGVLEKVGGGANMDALQTALGVVQVANTEMVGALRVISVEKGLDPREFALVAFGGAGPMHACALAEELNMSTVLVPKASGVLSALGLAVSDVRRDYVTPLLSPLSEVKEDQLEEAFEQMEEAGFGPPGRARVYPAGRPALRGPVFRAHGRGDRCGRAGGQLPRRPRAALRLPDGGGTPGPGKPPSHRHRSRREAGAVREGAERGRRSQNYREANFDGEWMEVPVLDRTMLGVGSEVEGPAVVEFAESTCVVRPGWGGKIDEVGTLILEREQ